MAILPCVGYPSFRTVQIARAASPEALYSQMHLAPHGPLYAQYRMNRYYFFLPIAASSLVKALVIAFGKGSGTVQVALLLAIEIIGLVAVIALRPYKTKGNHAMSIYLAVTRLVCVGLLIAFIQGLSTTPIIRTAIGLVTALIFSVAVLVVVISLVVNTFLTIYRHGVATTFMSEDEEKASHAENFYGSRPTNPTPEHSPEGDSDHLQPMTPTTVSRMSTRIRESASTNLGSLLSRHWSFTPMHSPAATSATPHSTILSRTPESPTLFEEPTRSHR